MIFGFVDHKCVLLKDDCTTINLVELVNCWNETASSHPGESRSLYNDSTFFRFRNLQMKNALSAHHDRPSPCACSLQPSDWNRFGKMIL